MPGQTECCRSKIVLQFHNANAWKPANGSSAPTGSRQQHLRPDSTGHCGNLNLSAYRAEIVFPCRRIIFGWFWAATIYGQTHLNEETNKGKCNQRNRRTDYEANINKQKNDRKTITATATTSLPLAIALALNHCSYTNTPDCSLVPPCFQATIAVQAKVKVHLTFQQVPPQLTTCHHL